MSKKFLYSMVVILIVMLPVSLIVFLIKSIVSELFSPLAELGSEKHKNDNYLPTNPAI
jgi:uncharacterized membrane protein